MFLRQYAPGDTAPAVPPSPAPDDYERARRSSLFPVISRPPDRSPSDHPENEKPAAGEQKIEAPTVYLIAT
jgi:hypothetical protein